MDDARYPPNPHHPKPRSKAPFRHPPPPPRFGRRYPDDEEEEEEEEDEEEEQNDIDQPMDDDDDDDDDGSSESRGKRKRIDELALGYEFAPRVPPAAAAASSKPPARTSRLDWSENASYELPDAWGDRYHHNGRRSCERSEVAKRVSQASKVNRPDAQWVNHLDTPKKKHKREKASMAEHGNAGSKWVYFNKMDGLMPSSSPPPPPGRQQMQQEPPYAFASSSLYRNRYNGKDEMRDGPVDRRTEDDGDEEDGDSDGLPPKRVHVSRSSDSSFKMLAESIQKFGDIYEKMENHNRQQMAELERMRKEFQRDLEVQKRQILERAQAEIAKLREEEQGGGDDEEDDDDGDDGGSADNLSGFISASFYLTAFV